MIMNTVTDTAAAANRRITIPAMTPLPTPLLPLLTSGEVDKVGKIDKDGEVNEDGEFDVTMLRSSMPAPVQQFGSGDSSCEVSSQSTKGGSVNTSLAACHVA